MLVRVRIEIDFSEVGKMWKTKVWNVVLGKKKLLKIKMRAGAMGGNFFSRIYVPKDAQMRPIKVISKS